MNGKRRPGRGAALVSRLGKEDGRQNSKPNRDHKTVHHAGERVRKTPSRSSRRPTIAPQKISQPLRAFVKCQTEAGRPRHVDALGWLEGAEPVSTLIRGKVAALITDPRAIEVLRRGHVALLIAELGAARCAYARARMAWDFMPTRETERRRLEALMRLVEARGALARARRSRADVLDEGDLDHDIASFERDLKGEP